MNKFEGFKAGIIIHSPENEKLVYRMILGAVEDSEGNPVFPECRKLGWEYLERLKRVTT